MRSAWSKTASNGRPIRIHFPTGLQGVDWLFGRLGRALETGLALPMPDNLTAPYAVPITFFVQGLTAERFFRRYQPWTWGL
jgi:hypothetical protein